MKQQILRSVSLVLVLLSALFLFQACISPTMEILPEPKSLIWAIGASLPTANDFFDTLPEGGTVAFAAENYYEHIKSGENKIQLRYTSKEKKEYTLEATLTLIDDTQPPTVVGTKDLMAYVGDIAIAYYTGVTVSDNCGGELELKADYAAVDLTKAGKYPVTYYAYDHVGNLTMVEVTLHVYEEEITEEMLYAEIDPLISKLGLIGMSKEDQTRAIFQFVHTDAKITYIDTSDKTDWIREAYFCLQNRKGDCFSYFAVSKAFFERLGIENLDVQRLPGFTDDTHYWSMVNIANAGEAPRWYHYDATRIRNVSGSGALLTDAQVDAFSQQRAYWYYYDRSQYPATATEIITSRPDLT